jgi:competence protein ComEC
MMNFTLFFEDRSRWFLWWPVGLGIGISVYFSLSIEPSLSLTLILFVFSLCGAIAAYFYRNENIIPYLSSLILLSFNMGFTAAKIRTDWLNTPFLLKKIEDVEIEARIVDIEEQPNRRRLTLDHLTFLKDVSFLHKIRLTMPLSCPLTATIGDRVSLNTSLLPLLEPVSLQGYNFRRQAYFQGIGATGRIKSPVQIRVRQDNQLWLKTVRYQLTQTIRQHLPGQTGEIATALITGDRSGIHPTIRQAFTDAGLAHILAISGLHLTLVAGLIFLLFRRGLALIPTLAENYPIKKWTAVVVVLATFGYLSISGYGIPGQRAFVMISIVMLGILLDRNPLSMRLVAIAATVILLFRPESLLSASFQLSFAAVVGLIAAYEGGWGPLRAWSFEGGYVRKIIAYAAGLIVTTLIATLATTPYTLAIFNRITFQAIVGNFLAIPLTSILIMPAATVSVISLSFGGSEMAFQVLSFGLKQLIDIAITVASWPGAAVLIPTPPPVFLGLVTLGGLWICIWKSPWRWGGLIPCGFACLSLFLHHPANIYAAGDGTVIAYTAKDTLYVSDLNRGTFYTDQWMKELGLKQKKEWFQDQLKVGPVLLIRSREYSRDSPSMISKDMCQEKGLITTSYAWRSCKQWKSMPTILIDRYTLKRDGTFQIWTKFENVEIKSVHKSLGKRPWSGPFECIEKK